MSCRDCNAFLTNGLTSMKDTLVGIKEMRYEKGAGTCCRNDNRDELVCL